MADARPLFCESIRAVQKSDDPAMTKPGEFETVRFTTRGRVVIPRRLRKEFQITGKTRAVVMATPEGILLKPVTRHSIERLRGILKPEPGGKSFAAEWAEFKREERRLEEQK
jgi:bifunctional DNA-binding transcriptional regulator/antitoxin component of YhaV-PrlF toxin-antitoxin module